MTIIKQRAGLLAAASPLVLAGLMAGCATSPSDGGDSAGPFFQRTATLPVYHNRPDGTDPAEGTAAEIVTATPDGMTLIYTDSPGERIGFVDIADPAAPRPAGTIPMDGEPTSVTVVGDHALVAIDQSESFTDPAGELAVVDIASREVLAHCDLGGQPDSVAASPDGRFLAVAMENQRDEEVNDGAIPQLPAGNLTLLDLGPDGAPVNCDSPRVVDLTGLAEVAPEDPEPEFVDINADGIVAVTLQENNHIALVDAATGEVTGHFPAGTVDLTAVDLTEDGVIAPTETVSDLRREPDAIGWLGTDRLVTANEGDWEGGSRSFTVFDTNGAVEFDSGNALDHLGMRIGHYPEGRSDAKGVEPEGAEVGRFGGETLMFVNSERANFVAVYADRGAGAEPAFVQVLPTAVAPEGVVAIPSRDLVAVATEEDSEEDGIRATISLYARTADSNPYPRIVSTDDPATGAPIAWGALSGLAADPSDADRLYAVSDSAYAVSRLHTIETASTPAVITGAIDLTKDGQPAGYDLEGVALRAEGGFWLASEGDAEAENPLQQRSLLLQVNADGRVEREIALPEALQAQATSRGFEGVAAWGEGANERVILAVQNGWEDDPANTTKLAIYAPATDSWNFVRYPLEAPASERGGWIGLSEITWLGDERFALIERDNQPGDYAAIKTITTIDLAGVTPAPYGGTIPTVEKTVALDLIGPMKADQGWITDKPEGFAVTADGRLLLLTDNDGVDGANGETQLLDIGTRDQLN
ncbi:esterase-like activity of phytase family protein [Marinivivus vitaminiproducens]|uniref:esterase-like activity of phytase family protein n=1 Tax=Marinivivus vitaminiproducens TaxID=3035935 RepID=UPI0027A19FAB|nr:esterase-like activity of phytase family protein [Geminicoccaceae bacterium SCSIO 64248]